MDILMVVLRVVHIMSGIIWVGFGLFTYLILEPVTQSVSEDGKRHLRAVTQSKRFSAIFPIVSILTTVAGVILYLRVSDGLNADWFQDAGNIVLTIGSLAGLGASLHGGATLGSGNGKRATLIHAIEGNNGQPTPEQAQELARLDAYISRHTLISVVMTLVAVVGMASARYI